MTRARFAILATILLPALVAGGCSASARHRTGADAPLLAAADPSAGARVGRHALHATFGGTVGREDDGLTLGAAWEYRSTERVGLGAFGDVVLGGPSTTLLGGAGYFHLTPQLTAVAGPGVQFHRGESHLFARVGGWYDFPMGDWKMGPAVFFDFGLGDVAASIGLSFGFDF